MPVVQNIDIKHMTLTDHHAYANANVNYCFLITWWQFNLLLLQNQEFCEQFDMELAEFLNINRRSVDDARYLIQ